MTPNDLKELSNEKLLRNYACYFRDAHELLTKNKHQKAERKAYKGAAFKAELMRRLEFYKVCTNLNNFILEQEDSPPEFDKLFQQHMRELLA